MTHNTWSGRPGPWQQPPRAGGNSFVQDVELPMNLRGPFLREFVPQSGHKHRGAQIASVVFYRNGGHSVITVRGAHHENKPMMARPTSVCLIARGRHQVSFEMQLPTQGDQSDFTCQVDINWEVTDFHLVAEKRVVDVERMLRPPLLGRLRGITRRHGLSGAQAADEAIQAELAGGHWSPFGGDIGLATQVFVRIDLGRAASDHYQALTQVQHDATVQAAVDRAEAARVEANLADARKLIDAGEAEQYAVLLARDPSRATEILGALQTQAKQQRQGALEYLTRLIDQGVVQRHQVEGQVQQLIEYAKAVGGSLIDHGLPQPATSLLPPPVVVDRTPVTPIAPAADAPPSPPLPPMPPHQPRPAWAQTDEAAQAAAAGGAPDPADPDRIMDGAEESARARTADGG
ncbi:hypothetical protein [Streptomyces sp. CBMA29]|uniref:hypothetical protein n=1 Tax=Streptomyces sp. CBMA29 TaxID=1896314 RepID=UPI001661BEB4|nr:hypothetical protein [Streptomyces sp. CBMA29]MBD0738512.1 hypothetical protein [Streptomyces sp. CBMA29]